MPGRRCAVSVSMWLAWRGRGEDVWRTAALARARLIARVARRRRAYRGDQPVTTLRDRLDESALSATLTQRLAKRPEDPRLFPGHHYAEKPESTLADERRNNMYMRVGSLEDWRRVMGVAGSS